MHYLFLVFVLLLFPVQASADNFYKIVRVECDQKNNLVIVSYEGAYNEAGEALVQTKGENAWDPWSLVEVSDSGESIEKLNTVEKTCKLIDGIYTIKIGPSPGNMNPQGNCGANMSAWVSISKENTSIVKTDFEGRCDDMEAPIITKVTVRSGTSTPKFIKKKWDEFFQ